MIKIYRENARIRRVKMKTFFKIIFILFILFVGFIAAVMYFTSPITLTAENFFYAIQNNNYREAGKYLSANFKKTTTVEQVKQAFPYERFKNFAGCSFTNRSVTADGTGMLEGKVEFKDGSFMKVKINLIKENGEWKIDHITVPKAGLTEVDTNGWGSSEQNADNNRANYQQPSNQNENSQSSQTQGANLNEEQLVHSAMVSLVNAILSDDYNDFYNSTSTPFKNTVSLVRTQSAFRPFKNVKINWQDIKDMKPVITSREKEEQGIIKYLGYYPTSPLKVYFNFEFYPENGEYKIFGAFLKVK